MATSLSWHTQLILKPWQWRHQSELCFLFPQGQNSIKLILGCPVGYYQITEKRKGPERLQKRRMACHCCWIHPLLPPTPFLPLPVLLHLPQPLSDLARVCVCVCVHPFFMVLWKISNLENGNAPSRVNTYLFVWLPLEWFVYQLNMQLSFYIPNRLKRQRRIC